MQCTPEGQIGGWPEQSKGTHTGLACVEKVAERAFLTGIGNELETCLPLTTSGRKADKNHNRDQRVDVRMSAPKRFEPKLDQQRLDDLRERVDRACNDAQRNPEPVAPFEMDKQRFGLTHARHRQLLFAWRDFLDNKPIASSSLSNNARPGPDHDTYSAFEKRLSAFDHYTSDIEDISMHFIWERASTNANVNRPVIPILLLHGWPSSVVDFLNVIHPLAHPGASAPSYVPAFDVVVPSQTGYLWSTSPKVDGFGRGQHSGPQGDLLLSDEARIVHKLMLSLGYTKYVIQAGDWAAQLTREMARMYPKNVTAVHLNFCPAGPPALDPFYLRIPARLIPRPIKQLAYAMTPGPIASLLNNIVTFPIWRERSYYYKHEPTMADWLASYLLGFPTPLNEEERKKVHRSFTFLATGSGYAHMQGTRPSTLGLALQSDPGALLAWVGEKLIDWTDKDPSDAEILAVLTLYWCTDTMPRSIYNYRNRATRSTQLPMTNHADDLKQPFGMSDFPYELMPTPLAWMKATGSLQWYRKHDTGGHFAAMERPLTFVEDVRDCFAHIYRP